MTTWKSDLFIQFFRNEIPYQIQQNNLCGANQNQLHYFGKLKHIGVNQKPFCWKLKIQKSKTPQYDACYLLNVTKFSFGWYDSSVTIYRSTRNSIWYIVISVEISVSFPNLISIHLLRQKGGSRISKKCQKMALCFNRMMNYVFWDP